MPCDEAVGALGGAGESGRVGIPIQEELFMRIVGEGTKGGFGAAVNGAVRLDELHGALELLARQFGKTGRDGRVLKGEIINAMAGGALPAVNPKGAEIAIAIENHQWLGRRGSDWKGRSHEGVIRL